MNGFKVGKELKDAAESLDPEAIKEMKKCLQKMTHDGSPSLDAATMKQFKQFCRKSDAYVQYAFLLIMKELEQKHSEIRLSAFQVADELFNRSHAFREMLVIHLQAFLALTTETELKRPLPPPKSAANKLKTDALHAVQRWYDKFGQGYRKLAIGYDYLKNCRHIDFHNIQAQNIAEQQRIEREEKRKQKLMSDKLTKVLKEIAEFRPEVENCSKEAESCLDLLLPQPDDFSFLSSLETTDQETTLNIDNSMHRYSSEIKNDKNDKSAATENSSENMRNNQETAKTIEKEELTPKSLQDSMQDDKPLPLLNDSSEDAETMDDDNDEDVDMQAHGLSRPGHSITVEITVNDQLSVQETEDNTDVMRSLKESNKLIVTNYLPKVLKWLEILSKNGAKQEDIKSTIDLKVKLQNIKDKCQDLKMIGAEYTERSVKEEGDSDESDFEEVPEKEGFEPKISFHLRDEYGLSESSSCNKNEKSQTLKRDSSSSSTSSEKRSKITSLQWSLKERESDDLLADPSSRAATLARIKKERGVSSTQQCDSSTTGSPACTSADTSHIPVVNFGQDLEYWENPDKMEIPSVIKYDSLHRFWAPKEGQSENPSTHDLAALRNRAFSFTGTFEPVKWKCRASLPNGKLCERMDRVKCPFHGKIIARDEQGRPAASSSSNSSSCQTLGRTAGELPPWQDPELQREIEAATGHDLGSARSQKILDKAKGKGRGKRTGLTDIKAAKNTTRRRLENKVFNKSSMKRVCNTLDSADYKRVRDKFGNQFNYSLS